MASYYVAVSKPRLLKDSFFHKLSKPLYRFYSSTDKPGNEENPDPKAHTSTRESQSEMINNGLSRLADDLNRNPETIEDAICRIMEDDEWSTRLQSSITNLVPLLDHNLVYSILNRNPNRALQFFQWVEEFGFKHDRETHYKMIEILCKDRRLDDAKRILSGMSKKGLDYDEHFFVLMIHGYAKSNRKWDIVKNCVKIFTKMEESGVPRTIESYHPLLQVMINEKKYTMAEKFFDKMLSEGIVPTQHTYKLMISGFCHYSSRVETANRSFKDMKSRNLLPDFVVYNTMINGNVKVKKMEEAEKLLTEMKDRKMEPQLVTYNSMINGYCEVKKMEDAEKMFVEMKARNLEPNLITYNTMINGYSKVERMEDAEKVVVEMKGRSIEADLVTYASMIKGYVGAKRVEDALELVEEMKRKRFGGKVDDYPLYLGEWKEDCDVEEMSEAQRNVLRMVEDHVERLELLEMRDSARELSELANRLAADRQSKMKLDG